MLFVILDWTSISVAVLGIIVIVWGVVLTLVKFLIKEFGRNNDDDRSFMKNELLRLTLGSYLLLGLEILIAADVIKTIRNPDLREIAILAGIVAIRTVISYFLDWEMVELESKK